MEVNQIYELVNAAYTKVNGTSAVSGEALQEDLSNIVDVGTALFNANAVDNYVKTLVDRIGKVVFVNRPYDGSVPSILRDSYEYGSVLQKISSTLPVAVENEDWNLTDGASYPTDVFYQPQVENKFYNSKSVFRINMSFAKEQVKESFTSASDMNAFISMILGDVEKAMTIRIDAMVMRTIDTMIADVFDACFGQSSPDYTQAGDCKCVNLLKLYNQKFGTQLTAAGCLASPEFIRFASFTLAMYQDRLTKISTLFNIGGKDRFTAKKDLNLIMLSDFANSAKMYLYADTYHDTFVQLPGAQVVPYWQGSGLTYAFSDVSAVNIVSGNGKALSTSGILAVMFDRNAVGVSNHKRKTTSAYNANGDFYTNFYSTEAAYWNDGNENFVVFYVA